MKLTKLMLSACVAALALLSCQKEDGPSVPVEAKVKSVDVSIANMILTKSESATIAKGTKVNLKNFKIFLTDNNYSKVYEAFGTDGTTAAKTFFTSAEYDITDADAKASFHFVDPACTRVVVVANMGDIAWDKIDDKILIGAQQNASELALYGYSDLVSAGSFHNETKDNVTYQLPVYKAKVTVKPRVSRFEMDGFYVNFKSDPTYSSIKFKQIAVQNYYPETQFNTGNESGSLVQHVTNFADQASTFAWLHNGVKDWYRDVFASPVEVTPAAPSGQAISGANNCYAYHFFSGDAVPVIMIDLEADGLPAYLYSKTIKLTDGTPIEKIEEGHIYRMNAAGSVDTGGDGDIVIDEDDIDPADRCIDITVDVMAWEVILVTPEF